MISKAIGTACVVVALLITTILFTTGGPIIPHIIGPIILTFIGVFLLMRKTNTARTTG